MKQNPVNVLIADDHTIVREALALVINTQQDMEIIGQAANGQQAVELAVQHTPRIVLMDLQMPVLNGFEATRQILKHSPASKVIILSAYSEDRYVSRALSCGAAGYLVKHIDIENLLKSIRDVYSGNACFTAEIAKKLRDGCYHSMTNGTPVEVKRYAELTFREAEVLQLVAEGFSNKTIASQLNISIKTVEKHRQQVMVKLNIHDIASLTQFALKEGFCIQSPEIT